MRRALQQLRAVLTASVGEALDTRRVFLVVAMVLFVPIPMMVPYVVAFVLVALLKPTQAVTTLLILAALPGSAVGLVAGLAVPYFALKRYAESARRRAREIVLRIEATTPVVCPGCGGRAAVVALGPGDPCPCPWCGSELVPSGSAQDAVRTAAQALLAHHEQVAQRMMLALEQVPGARRRPPPLPGFALTGGGTVLKGATDGVPVRAFNEVCEGVFVFRLEVPAETGLEGEAFLVRPAVEGVMRSLAREWGYSLPERTAPSPRVGWLAYVEGETLTSAAALGEALDRLGPSDAVLLDPAGLSVWRKGLGLTHAWSLAREHHATVAKLARALAPGPVDLPSA